MHTQPLPGPWLPPSSLPDNRDGGQLSPVPSSGATVAQMQERCRQELEAIMEVVKRAAHGPGSTLAF